MRRILLIPTYLILILFALPTYAVEALNAPNISVNWLAPQSFSENSETYVGIRFQPEPQWHVYWKNPGDSGSAPKFAIKSKNAEVGPIEWPFPSRLPVAHLTNLGYEGDAVYLFKVKTGSQSPVYLEVDLEWLVCKVECVPGFGKLTLSRPVNGANASFKNFDKYVLETYRKKIPQNAQDSPYIVTLQDTSSGQLKAIVNSKTTLPNQLDLFPADAEYVQPAKPAISRTGSSIELLFQKSASTATPTHLNFVLVADGKAFEFTKLQVALAPLHQEPVKWTLLLVLLGSAILGGILLNLMPCVFPVISIKAVSLLKAKNKQERKRDGLLYTLGALTTFMGLGAFFLILRYLGAAAGWGFQLQSPTVVFALIILFWLMALNFLGIFEFGTSIMNSSGKVRWQSSFGTGALSVFVAAPCTGPFMGTALGATATMPGYQAMFIFFGLGLGLALPYLLLTLSDRFAQMMPKPGAWMETLKQFFAFPLFATVLWLLWVLGLQTGSDGWILTSIALLGISFALWLGKRQHKIWKYLAWLMAASLILFSVRQIQKVPPPNSTRDLQGSWIPYDEEKLNAALKNGQAVFIDFTAAWCITCQVNKKLVLETSNADEIFEKGGILKMRADWTNHDPTITQALSRLGRNSVPVYAYYSRPDVPPQLLPQILTLNMIQKLIPPKEEK